MAELGGVEAKDDIKEAVKDPDGLEVKGGKDLEAQMSSNEGFLSRNSCFQRLFRT